MFIGYRLRRLEPESIEFFHSALLSTSVVLFFSISVGQSLPSLTPRTRSHSRFRPCLRIFFRHLRFDFGSIVVFDFGHASSFVIDSPALIALLFSTLVSPSLRQCFNLGCSARYTIGTAHWVWLGAASHQFSSSSGAHRANISTSQNTLTDNV